MAVLLTVVALLISIIPATAAIRWSVGVPPEQGVLFGVCELAVAGAALGLLHQHRQGIQLIGIRQFGRYVGLASCASVSALIVYLIVYDFCVVESPLYKDRLVFPLWASGKLARMIENAGSRYGAVERYGLAAVFDAIGETPGPSYAIALGTLLLLYAPPLALASSVLFALALRQWISVISLPGASADAFEVFFCYNRADRIAVRVIASQLGERGVRFFIDERENYPGQAWTDYVERAIDTAPAFAVFLGAIGVGRWQAIEIQNIAEARVARGCSVIPVLLPDAPKSTRLPMQLAGLTWVDFRRTDPDPMEELVRGIRVAESGDNGPGQ
jgi:hypothetical protein